MKIKSQINGRQSLPYFDFILRPITTIWLACSAFWFFRRRMWPTFALTLYLDMSNSYKYLTNICLIYLFHISIWLHLSCPIVPVVHLEWNSQRIETNIEKTINESKLSHVCVLVPFFSSTRIMKFHQKKGTFIKRTKHQGYCHKFCVFCMCVVYNIFFMLSYTYSY